jgi:hypothetical protein
MRKIMRKIMWLKYRKKWSSSLGKWQWRYLSNMTLAQARKYVRDDFGPSLDADSDSEHYRGIDYHLTRRYSQLARALRALLTRS